MAERALDQEQHLLTAGAAMRRLLLSICLVLIGTTPAPADWAKNLICLNLAYTKPDEGITACTKIIERGDSNSKAEAYSSRGLAYYRKKQYDRAIKDLTMALELGRKDKMTYGLRGQAYLRAKDYDRAIADLNEVLAADPSSVVTYYDRGLAYEGKGDYDSAAADYEKALELNPSATAVKTALQGLAGKRKNAPPPRTVGAKEKPKSKAALPKGSAADLAFWDSVKDSSDPAELEAYLETFPNGTFVSLAKVKLKKLRD